MTTRQFLKLQAATLAPVLFGIASVVAAAPQQSMPTDNGASFQSLDKNEDGHLVRAEIPSDMALLRSRMSTYDANHDGMLDAQEYAAAEASLHEGGHAGGGDNAPPSERHH
jgi:hypothetical protein